LRPTKRPTPTPTIVPETATPKPTKTPGLEIEIELEDTPVPKVPEISLTAEPTPSPTPKPTLPPEIIQEIIESLPDTPTPKGPDFSQYTEEELEELLDIWGYETPLYGALLPTGDEIPIWVWGAGGIGSLSALLALFLKKKKH
jgi:hypothetical protein